MRFAWRDLAVNGFDWAEIVCVAGMNQASIVALARALPLAKALDAHLTVAAVDDLGTEAGDARFGRWVHEVIGVPPASCTVVNMTGAECALAGRLRELVNDSGADLLIVPSAAETVRELPWLSPAQAWSVAHERGAGLFIARPRVVPAKIVALTDFSVRTRTTVEVSSELGRALRVAVEYLNISSMPAPLGADAIAIKSRLADRGGDVVVLGLPAGHSRVPSVLARDLECSLLFVPLTPPLLH